MKRSYIEVILILVLFAMFVVNSFFIVLFGANSYNNIVTDFKVQDEVRTSLSYVSTKIYQAAKRQDVSVETIDGIVCLNIKEIIDDKAYSTIIYFKDEAIYELLVASNNIDLNSASKVLEIKNFDISIDDNMIILDATNSLMQTSRLTISRQ